MNLPESIQKITEERPADVFILNKTSAQHNIDQLIFLIKSQIGSTESRYFEVGKAFYKVANTEKTFIRNLIQLYTETVVTKLRDADIEADLKKAAINNFEKTCNSLLSIIDTQREFLNAVNKDKNLIDTIEISYIMLGYAIETIKKIHSSKTQ
jgi:hypothetical protein